MERNPKILRGLGPAILLAASIPLSAYADDMTINRMLASQCSQCHGTDGYAVGDIDSLAGESVSEIRDELLEMQSDGIPGDIMDHQALGYTDDQIRRIAEYFAALPEKNTTGAPEIRLSPSGSSQGEGESDDENDHQDHQDHEDHEDHEDQDEDEESSRDRDHDEDEHEDEHEDEED